MRTEVETSFNELKTNTMRLIQLTELKYSGSTRPVDVDVALWNNVGVEEGGFTSWKEKTKKEYQGVGGRTDQKGDMPLQTVPAG